MSERPIAKIRSETPIMLRDRLPAVFITFSGLVDHKEHFAVRLGDPASSKVLLRVHSECITGDLFGSMRCDCGAQLTEAIGRLALEGGYLLYMRQEGRGIGLYKKLDAYLLQDGGLDTFEANRALRLPEDGRNYHAAAQMIQALNLRSVRLLTNNRDKTEALLSNGIDVCEEVPTGVHPSPQNWRYLQAKEKHGHMLLLPHSDLWDLTAAAT
jgi:GTP cyclohydrolase II